MSKILPATCVGGVVKVGAHPIPGTTILSEGVAESSGILVLDEDEPTYIAKTTPDLKTAIEKAIDALDSVADALTQISTTFTSIGAKMTGATTAPPPTLATDVLAITSKVTLIQTAKTALTTLKGALK